MKTLILFTVLVFGAIGKNEINSTEHTSITHERRIEDVIVHKPIGNLFHSKSQRIVIYDKHGKIVFKKKLKKSDIKRNKLPIKARYLTTKKRIRYYMVL